MLKRIIAIMLTTAMLLGIAPTVLATVPTTVPEAEIVDLIHDSNGDVRDGVVPSYGATDGSIPTLNADIGLIIDGNDSSATTNDTTYFRADQAYYQIDLGGIKTVTNIKYSMMLAAFSGNLYRCEQYCIKISNDENFNKYEVVASVEDIQDAAAPRHCVVDLSGSGSGSGYSLTTSVSGMPNTTGEGDNRIITFAGGPKKCRYIRVEKIRWSNICCDEISVMGSECSKESFGTWEISDNSQGTERTFSIPVAYENDESAHEFNMVCANYNANGEMTNSIRSTDNDSELSTSIPTETEDTKSIAVAIPTDEDYLFTPPVATYGFDGFGADIGTADAFANAISTSKTEEYFQADIKTVDANDLVVAAAVMSDAESGEEAFEESASYAWYGAANSDNGYSFKMPFTDAGNYHIRISRYPIDGDAEHKYYTFTKIDTVLLETTISGIIKANSDESLKDAVDFAINDSKMITSSDLVDESVFGEEGIYSIFEDVCGYMIDNEAEIDLEKTIDILNTTAVVYDLSTGSAELYKANPEYIDNNEDIKLYVQEELGYVLDLTITSDVADGSEGVTNIGSSGLITYTFDKAMNPDSLTQDSVVIKENGSKIEYTPYQKSENAYVIDKTILSSNSNYTVTFNEGCKTEGENRILEEKTFSFKTGEILDAPYKDGYIIKNVALEKTVVSPTTAQWKSPSALLDGKKGNDYLIYFQGSTEVIVDLEDYYDIFRINIAGPDVGRYYHIREASVSACRDASFGSNSTAVFKYPFDEADLRPIVDMSLDVDLKNVRYFKFGRGTTDLIMSEFSAYAYIKTEFGAWDVPSFGGEGTYKISKAVNEYGKSDSYFMILSAYDEYGYTVASTVAETEVIDGKLSASITAPSGTVGISAAIVKDLQTMQQLTDPITIGSEISASASDKEGISVISDNASISLNVGKSNDIEDISRVIAVVVSAGDSDLSAEDAFAAMTAKDLEENLVYATAQKCDDGFKYVLDKLDDGKYYIGVTAASPSGNTVTKYYKIKFNPQESQQKIEDIMNATNDEELETAVNSAVDAELISSQSLVDKNSYSKSGIYDIFDVICGIMADEDVSLAELTEILNTVSVVYAVSNGSFSLYEKYPDYIDDNAGVSKYVSDELGYVSDLTITSNVADGSEGVTNIGSSGLITYSFNKEMNPDSLTSGNITIRKNGSKITYSPIKKDEYTYAIDKSKLSSNSSYTVTFTRDCETKEGKKILKVETFSFKTGKILNKEYREGYIIENVALGKEVIGEKYPGENYADPSAIVDGDTTKFSYIKGDMLIDLKDYYDVFQINVLGPDDGRSYMLRDAVFTASEGDKDFKEGVSLIYSYPNPESELKKLLDLTLDLDIGKIRYLKFDRQNTSLFLREITAYAYVKTEFGEWDAPEFSGAGNYTISKPINEYDKEGSYFMILTAYDADGYTVASKVAPVNNEGGKLSASIIAPSSAVGISAAIVSDLKSMQQVTDPLMIGEVPEKLAASGEGISINGNDTSVTVNVGQTESGSIKNTARTITTVVKTTDVGVSAKDAYESMSADDMQSNLVFALAHRCEAGFEYLIDKLGEGKYYIRTTATSLDGNTYTEYYKLNIISETDREYYIEQFMSADDAGIGAWIDVAFEQKEILTNDSIEDPSVNDNEEYHKIVTYVRGMLYPDSASVTKLEQITDIMDAAAVVKAFYDADATKAAKLTKSSGAKLGENFDPNVDVSKFTTVFANLKSKITDAATLAKVLKRGAMLSYMQNGTNEDKVNVLTNYSEEFGVDLSYAENKNVSLERSAEYLDCTDVSAYYEDGQLKQAFEDAVDDAYENKPSTPKPIGGGGSAVTMPMDPKPDPTPTPTLSPTSTPEQSESPFSDMENYSWANDAVNTLYEKGILKGYDDGSFRPQNNVTRAEFIKMLVVATKIQVVEETPMNFIDVPDGSWYFPYIRIAYTNKLCSGVSEYYFNPNALITRQDMAVLVDNYMKYAQKTADGQSKQFADANTISDYAISAVDNASAAGIINGYDDGSFRPKENATRAEAAIIVSKIMN